MQNKITKVSYTVIQIFGVAISIFLLVSSMVFTQYMLPFSEEQPLNTVDNVFLNLIFICGFVIILYFVWKLNEHKDNKIVENLDKVTLAIASLWIGIGGILWNISLDRAPEGDQAFIYEAATHFLIEDYSLLEKGGYCQFYPQQLTFVAIIEAIIYIFKSNSYLLIQIIFSVMNMLIPILSNLILREINCRAVSRVLSNILFILCLPLIFYSSWLYGEIPSIVCILTVCMFTIKIYKHFNVGNIVMLILSCALSVWFRRNSLIMLLALGLVCLFLMPKRRCQMLLVFFIASIVTFTSLKVIAKYYENKSGFEISSGLPTVSWIAMGMQEDGGICGWYNNMPKDVAYSVDLNMEEAERRYYNIINERIGYFISNPNQAIIFGGRKLISQWDAPFYQSLYFSAKGLYAGQGSEVSFYNKLYYSEDFYMELLSWLDKLQIVIYFGFLTFFIYLRSEESSAGLSLLGITIIGGFLFSIIWEAKARYCFPYFILMFPCAARGWETFINRFSNRIKQR